MSLKPKTVAGYQYMQLMPGKWGILTPQDKELRLETTEEDKVVEFINGLATSLAEVKE